LSSPRRCLSVRPGQGLYRGAATGTSCTISSGCGASTIRCNASTTTGQANLSLFWSGEAGHRARPDVVKAGLPPTDDCRPTFELRHGLHEGLELALRIGDHLLREIGDRLKRGSCRFHIVVPATPPDTERAGGGARSPRYISDLPRAGVHGGTLPLGPSGLGQSLIHPYWNPWPCSRTTSRSR
jgi:hypothetical protein